ncbi:MAG: hypothetical protein JSU74_06495 [Candidatus Zixiibacteriota bacterium]|nr:MAG: hypothetical protein JSU74_06495 [candidate division Zixibacteria bacterium]
MPAVDFVGSVNLVLALFDESIRQFRRGRIWLLLLGYFFLLWLVLQVHYRFYSPTLFSLIEIWIRQFDSSQATAFTHYPDHLVQLPYFFGWARTLLSIPFEGGVLAIVSVLFYRSYLGRGFDGVASAKQFLSVWLQVTVAWAVLNGLLLIVSDWLPKVFEAGLKEAALRALVFRYMFQPFLYLLIYSLFFFTIPYIAINRSSAFRGIGESVRIFWRNPITCYFLGAAVFVPAVIVTVATHNAGALIERFGPEAAYWVLVIGLGIGLVTNFFWTAVATRFLIDLE